MIIIKIIFFILLINLIIYLFEDKNISNKNILDKIINIPKIKQKRTEYDDEIKDIFIKLKQLKNKNNKDNFNNGKKYWKLFIKYVNLLNNKNIYNYNQYFDNASMYFKKSIQYLTYLTLSIEEKNMEKILKYNDILPNKKFNDYNKLIKELYIKGYNILFNLSLKLNKIWNENPNMYTKEIIMDNYFEDNNFNNNKFNFNNYNLYS